MKHKRDRVQTGTSLYKVPILVMIGQYNNQDSWMYIRTPGYISGPLDVRHPRLPNHAGLLAKKSTMYSIVKKKSILLCKFIQSIHMYIRQCL